MEIVAAQDPGRCAGSPLSDFRFELPEELIAQLPAAERDHARLCVLDRRNGAATHARVADLPEYLRPGDLLVVNDTRVVPARIFARTPTGGAVELLVLRPNPDSTWRCIGKPARRLRPRTVLTHSSGARLQVAAAPGGGFYDVSFDETQAVSELLDRHGEIPLPPYIRRADGPLPLDRERYQTMFASAPGAVAAPTAGLHFTPALVDALGRRGVELARLTLHVGPGTFLPVRDDDLANHVMEPEWCEIPAATAAAIRATRAAGGRIVAIGTTTTRALESAATGDAAIVQEGSRWADRFIVPGHAFQVVDCLFTNFHLPGSTLLLLVAAFAGRESIQAAYAEAVRLHYRFYSYGDAMLIL